MLNGFFTRGRHSVGGKTHQKLKDVTGAIVLVGREINSFLFLLLFP